MAGFGVSFLGDDDERKRTADDQYQRAVQILSLRVPRRPQMQGAIAPAPLLQAPGAQGMPFGAVAQTQMGQPPRVPMAGRPQSQGRPPSADPVRDALLRMSGMPPQGAPQTPRIIPGITSPDELAREAQELPGLTPPAPAFGPAPAEPPNVHPFQEFWSLDKLRNQGLPFL